MFKCGILILTILNIFFTPVWAETQQNITSKQENFILEQISKGLGVPWGMAFVSANEIIFTEREGSISLLNLKTGRVTRLKGHPNIMVTGQGGMLDVAVPRNFSADDWIYFTYVKDKNDNGVTVLARAKLVSNQLQNWQDLLITKSATDTGRHFGSRIAFDAEHVFFTVGDRGVRPNGQDLSNHAAMLTLCRKYGVTVTVILKA
jgi:glucose/arabinose dehydrogenase